MTKPEIGSLWANKRKRMCKVAAHEGALVVVIWRDTLTMHHFLRRRFLNSFTFVEPAVKPEDS